MDRSGRGHRPQLRHLHDDGHGQHHDGHRRSHRHDPAGRLVNSGGGRQPHAHVRRVRPPCGRHGVGRPDAQTHPEPGVVQERHQRRHGDGLFHQRHRAPGRHVAPRGPRRQPGRLRRRQPQGAGHRQHPAQRRYLPDGRLLLRGRLACAHVAPARPPGPVGHDRHG
ncbi:hypothetical protein G6F35_016725 [Rhizopus arrhizus]|nr:hypothetical protein G6F35_016725 [Rhizopus arrhizus]